jgi:hypothetical protein
MSAENDNNIHRETAWVVTWAKALTDRATTHRDESPVSDPSELGSEPDSWLEYSFLRARKKIKIVGTRGSRGGNHDTFSCWRHASRRRQNTHIDRAREW